MKLRCLIVDDEPPAIEVLRSYINSIPMLEVAGECQHAMAAFDFLQKHPVDLLFLDIRMPPSTRSLRTRVTRCLWVDRSYLLDHCTGMKWESD